MRAAIASAVLLLGASVLGQSAPPAAPTARVVDVIDGDTVALLIDGRRQTVRLIGVDTPETVHPTKPVERMGKEASAFTRSLLSGRQVTYEFDDTGARVDRYGRLLLYVYRVPDRLLVNREIVRRGFGHAYTEFPFRHMESFRAAEREARAARAGLWAPEAPGATEPPPAATPGMVLITSRGSKYHRPGCPTLNRSTPQEVALSGLANRYLPCSVCRPPGR